MARIAREAVTCEAGAVRVGVRRGDPLLELHDAEAALSLWGARLLGVRGLLLFLTQFTRFHDGNLLSPLTLPSPLKGEGRCGEDGLRYDETVIAAGAQTRRPSDAGPVRLLLGGEDSPAALFF